MIARSLLRKRKHLLNNCRVGEFFSPRLYRNDDQIEIELYKNNKRILLNKN